jgi:D-alanyl-D-alanine carboxypeptidase
MAVFLGFFALPALCFCSCAKTPAPDTAVTPVTPVTQDGQAVWYEAGAGENGAEKRAMEQLLKQALLAAELPVGVAGHVLDKASEGPSFILDLLICLSGEPELRALVDKSHPLPDGYEPDDLVELTGPSYRVSRQGHLLRRAAAESLEEMAAAAGAEGIRLMASSAYRSYAYQREVYARNVREMGQEAADRESARPGYSQHQTGLVVDFGSIDDSFAATPAGRWMSARASGFGWSLSFPEGYEAVTGYRWESWHYRYVGQDLAAFIDSYFGGVQQYALRFIHEWESLEKTR